ncbi:hypothetical protein H0O00_02130 [Candidatus Micrarchaeota archaeon]|nr:hypothetical protein [Candidatus Micrarchaeota archaeon]
MRGQVATEFLLYTAVFMFVAVAAFIVINDVQRSELPLQQNTVAKNTGEGFVSTLTLAVKGGEGFSYRYTFPRNILGISYSLDMNKLDDSKWFMLEWPGTYGNFSYQYGVPDYPYKLNGTCLGAGMLVSDACSNVLMLSNDGENLTITQLP